MALTLHTTACRICGRPRDAEVPVVSFPAFVANPRDPIAFFSDSAFHEECFRRHPLANDARARYQEFRGRTPPGNSSCAHCGRRIAHPDEYLGLGHLTADRSDPAFPFNYAQFHRACVKSWPELPQLRAVLSALATSGAWEEAAICRILTDLDRAE
jgi:hypothetical protein